MIDRVRFLLVAIEDEINALDFITQRLYSLKLIGCVDVNMSDLMIRHSKRITRSSIQEFQALLIAHAQQTRLAKLAIDMHRIVHRLYAIFTEEDDANALRIEILDQLADDAIHLLNMCWDLWMIRPELLKSVVKVRQVDQRQRWLMELVSKDRGICDPLTGLDG